MATSPIRSSTRAGASQSPSASEAEREPPTRRRATPDATTPSPLRRRTSRGSVEGTPRRTGALPTRRAGTPDSLASLRSFSSFEDWAHPLSPAAAGPSQAASPASRSASPDRDSDSPLPSLRSLEPPSPWERMASPSRDSPSPLPSLHSLVSSSSSDPPACAADSTAADARRVRESSLDSVGFAPDRGHPEAVHPRDEATIDTMIGLLERLVAGETFIHI
ncbi:MAG: hypothetical protein ABW220_13360, partial [Burkholderiaceae bacterium]